MPVDRALAEDDSAAIALLSCPLATSRSTCSSRAGQSVGAAPGRIASSRAGPAPPSRGERRRAPLELERRGVVVAERAAREPDQDARAGGLVGRPDLLPRPRGLPRRRPSAARGLRVGELDRAPGRAAIAPSIPPRVRRRRSPRARRSRAAPRPGPRRRA